MNLQVNNFTLNSITIPLSYVKNYSSYNVIRQPKTPLLYLIALCAYICITGEVTDVLCWANPRDFSSIKLSYLNTSWIYNKENVFRSIQEPENLFESTNSIMNQAECVQVLYIKNPNP